MVSRVQFIECSGNSRPNLSPTPPATSCGAIHGLVSCSEWTGVPLSILLAEAGVDRSAQWLLAEGRGCRRGRNEPERADGEGDG